MHGLTTFQELEIVTKISFYSADKLKINQSDLESYLTEKLIRIRKNFCSELGNPYQKYLTINLRLYSLNYLRDLGSATKLSGANLRVYSKIDKWKSLKITSRRLGKSIEELRVLKDTVINNRSSHILTEDKIDTGLTIDNNSNIYFDFVVSLGGIKKVNQLSADKLKELFLRYSL
jgi:hypothetical protein